VRNLTQNFCLRLDDLKRCIQSGIKRQVKFRRLFNAEYLVLQLHQYKVAVITLSVDKLIEAWVSADKRSMLGFVGHRKLSAKLQK